MIVGEIVSVYTDPYWNLGYEGEAELIEFREHGLPFILNETADKHQITYQHEKWLVNINGFRTIRKIRCKISSGGVVYNDEKPIFSSRKIDKFLEIDGREIY